MAVVTRVDAALRDLAMLRLTEFRPDFGRALVGDAVDELLRRVDPRAVRRSLSSSERSALVEELAPATPTGSPPSPCSMMSRPCSRTPQAA